MKRKWLAIPLVTGLLAAGLTGASALAHNGDGEGNTPKETWATKVAEILGIEDEQTVKDALQQATREVRLDRLEHRLSHMVEGGVLTQGQADEYLAWYEARPEGLNLHRGGHQFDGFAGNETEGGQPQSGFRGQGLAAKTAPELANALTEAKAQTPGSFPTAESSLAGAWLAPGLASGSVTGNSPGRDNFHQGWAAKSPAKFRVKYRAMFQKEAVPPTKDNSSGV